jgi:hypothetical protein
MAGRTGAPLSLAGYPADNRPPQAGERMLRTRARASMAAARALRRSLHASSTHQPTPQKTET